MSEARTFDGDIRDTREAVIRIEALLSASLPHLVTKAELAELRTDVAGLRGELHTEVAGLRTADAGLRGDMTTGFAELRRELAQLELRLVVWLGGVVVVAAAALFSALRYWPPHI